MKIILVHNFYGSGAPSGENEVFFLEKALLEKNDHNVRVFTRHNDEIIRQGVIGSIRGAASVIWNPISASKLKKEVQKFKPDIIHAHNTFPLISPSIFSAVGNSAAKVLTLHNYRLFCSAGIPSRNGSICIDCIDSRSVVPAVKYGCYRDSRIATIPISSSIEYHRRRGTWSRDINAFIALSGFQQKLMIEGGLPSNKVHVKPNFYLGDPAVVPMSKRENYIVFVGRLSKEKGVKTLIDAWKLIGSNPPELRIVGDGPLAKDLKKQSRDLPIKFHGHVSFEEAQEQISRARILIMPSECFEGFPMVIREAFALGTPVLASQIGPLGEIVQRYQNGLLFEPGNANSIASTVMKVFLNKDLLEKLSIGARGDFDSLYNERANYNKLTKIYESAILDNKECQ